MKTPINLITSCLFTASLGVSSYASAMLKPGSFMSKDGAEITPTLQTGLSTNNNMFKTPDNEQSRLIWSIAPNILAVIDDGPDNYKLNFGTQTSFHNKDTTDNYTQVNVGAALHKEFTRQHSIDLSADMDWLYEPRGSGLTEGLGNIVDELVEYNQQDISAKYKYGSRHSKAQLAFAAGFYSKKYQNFRAVSQYRDYDKTLLGITGFYNTHAATRTFLELKEEQYRYDTLQANGVSRDSDDRKILLGIEWDATAVTSGTFKIGYQDKDFISQLREDFNGVSWEAAVLWQPLTYSSIKVLTSRSARDPLVAGDYIKESIYNISWEHNWRNDLSSLASLNYADEHYTDNTNRQDKTKTARVALSYLVTSFGMVSSYVDFIDKNSNQSRIEYDRLIIGVNFTFALKAN
ncbi:outer membrane beta-barrel protein [Pseudoalteromonas sp.]|uniref:outer membrane beta-barrel protein n=1 Tax=Pseudoalteromonas sp. TaxID=53249 RepID=UPI0035658C81